MRKSVKSRCFLFAFGLPCLSYIFLFIRFKWSCDEALNDLQHVNTTDYLLNRLLNECGDNIFNFKYLQEKIRDFQCPQTRMFLTVSRSLTALASYPGSGNTWTRELIETVTGLHTGSVYTDWNFVGSRECPTRGKVFIIKTHAKNNLTDHRDCAKIGVTHLNYSQAIYILRNPYDALVAEFNRRNAKNAGTETFFNEGEGLATQNDFKSKKWDNFLLRESKTWKAMTLYWLQKFDKPVYVLLYERLRKNSYLEMYNLMKFLNIQIEFKSLFCLSSNTTGNYHRIKADWMARENLFETSHRKLLNEIINSIVVQLGITKHISDVLQSYILPLTD